MWPIHKAPPAKHQESRLVSRILIRGSTPALHVADRNDWDAQSWDTTWRSRPRLRGFELHMRRCNVGPAPRKMCFTCRSLRLASLLPTPKYDCKDPSQPNLLAAHICVGISKFLISATCTVCDVFIFSLHNEHPHTQGGHSWRCMEEKQNRKVSFLRHNLPKIYYFI
jgi:hypothetical protein